MKSSRGSGVLERRNKQVESLYYSNRSKMNKLSDEHMIVDKDYSVNSENKIHLHFYKGKSDDFDDDDFLN